jgi:predicted acylesterase/phospholipase RssA
MAEEKAEQPRNNQDERKFFLFSDVFAEELKQIEKRRKEWFLEETSESTRDSLCGLALSGGGIRSATFCLGLLQAMNELRLLPLFDYLSTVSGGGFVGGAWSAWLARRDRPDFLAAHWPGSPPDLERLKEQVKFDKESKTLRLVKPLRPPEWQALSAQAASKEQRDAIEHLLRSSRFFLPDERVEPQRPPAIDFSPPEDLDEADSGNAAVPAKKRKRAAAEVQNNAAPAVPRQEVPESAATAADDPIHHLRLFSNYLTPRKGLFSADTWRAATFVTRNLALTWLMLLPILFLLLLAARIYFIWEPIAVAAQDQAAWVAQLTDDEKSIAFDQLERAGQRVVDFQLRLEELESAGQEEGKEYRELKAMLPGWQKFYRSALLNRAKFAARPLIALTGWIGLLTLLWLALLRERPNARDWAMIFGGSATLLLLLACLYGFVAPNPTEANRVTGHFRTPLGIALMIAWCVVAVGMITWVFFPRSASQKKLEHLPSDVRRVRIIQLQAILLALTFFLAIALLLAGFAWELPAFIFRTNNIVARAGGWLVLLATAAGSVYSAFATAPSATDEGKQRTMSRKQKFVLLLTPPLLLLVLTATLSWLAFQAVKYGANATPTQLQWLTAATFVGLLLCFFLAGNEIHWRTNPKRAPWILGAVSLLVLICGYVGFSTLPWEGRLVEGFAYVSIPLMGAVVLILIILRLSARHPSKDQLQGSRYWPASALEQRRRHRWVQLFLFLITGVLAYLGGELAGRLLVPKLGDDRDWFDRLPTIVVMGQPFATLTLCILFVAFELYYGKGKNWRTLLLLLAAWLLVMAVVAAAIALRESPLAGSLPADPLESLVHYRCVATYVATNLVALCFCWVVALGWTADPNALSLHSFYKSRLVRAYLGASNPARADSLASITDSVEGDDIYLKDLNTAAVGGPYHLINTTLNLVAARDLATSQRFASSFLLSNCFCGSSKTGYRRTSSYMGGEMTLGSAVAISGAAASPNMGSKSFGAPLAMLMTLMNVRLGYWAPTPNRRRWTSRQARLWLFYTLYEFGSQTNDLSSYCYLTDGGHFDNAGLYSLVERGCRFIVLADCGADPDSKFEDMGDAIRRCRIDFGAEIELDPSRFRDEGENGSACLLGKVTYSVDHVQSLKWPEKTHALDKPEMRQGLIIWFKPRVLPKHPADIKQYKWQAEEFPQQTTADQWFDEAQFESYRQLGETAAQMIFQGHDATREIREKVNGGHPLPRNVIKNLFDQVGKMRANPPAKHAKLTPNPTDTQADS